jgi:predicted DNA-binding transcriptional regulator YafY
MKTRKHYHSWTKDELREFLTLWESCTTEELAERFGVSTATIYSTAARFRELGVPVQKKKRVNTLNLLMQEVAAEMTTRTRKTRA